MTMTKLSATLYTIFSLLFIHKVVSFAPVPIKSFKNGQIIPISDELTRAPLTSLRYRPLDENDDDTTMLKVQNRVPVGYDMRKALASRQKKTAMNQQLIRALLLNQSLILALATAATYGLVFFTEGLDGISNLGEMLHWTGGPMPSNDLFSSMALGALGAIPMVLFTNVIENSDKREFATVNFSTITMVMTLFGRRSAPPQDFVPKELKASPILTTKWTMVLFQSVVLALTTGICEETVFRQEVPALVSHYVTGDNVILTLLAQATLFGLGHAQPGTSLVENCIVILLQAINGVFLGVLYLATGGNIIACITAHTIFDFVVFFKTWMDANEQLEYAERMYSRELPQNVEREVQKVLSATPVDARMLKVMKRLFYTFDFDKNASLSLPEVRKGFSYLALERAGTPPPQALVDSLYQRVVETRTDPGDGQRLAFPDFLRLYAMAASQKKATA